MPKGGEIAMGFRLGQRTYSAHSLHGQVVHELGRRIVSGEIGEGVVLPNEAELGAEFDVSRTALREGIKVLAAKGLLASRTRTGTRVRPRSDWNMLDPDVLNWRMETADLTDFAQNLYEFRCATEPMAASLAASRADDTHLSTMEAALDEMERVGTDIQASVEPDLRFHQALLLASGNELLASLSAMIETALVFSFQMCTPEHKPDAVAMHRDVLEAVRSRDSVQASEAMYTLLGYARDWNAEMIAGLDGGASRTL